ncbi:MAG: ankyrin repeat domain-containing protein [Burkholderiaceae bacterium]
MITRVTKPLLQLAFLAMMVAAGGASANDGAKGQPGKDDPRIQLLEAVLADDGDAVQDLLVQGVNPNIKEVDRGPAVVMAATVRSYRALGQLLAAPATDIEATNNKGETALVVVAGQGNLAAAKSLIRRGAKINREGWTPLHAAVRSGQANIVNLLIQSGAHLNAKAKDGSTPMILAARFGHFSAYEHIVRAGADPRPVNKDNYSAADYLSARGDTVRASLLRDYVKKYKAVK